VSLPRSAGDAVSSSTPMSEHPPALVTAVLQRLQAGDVAAADELMPMVYTELRAIAGRLLRERRAGHTLQPTALVHEAWLKMAAPATAGPPATRGAPTSSPSRRGRCGRC
jgi:hypothetical protein